MHENTTANSRVTTLSSSVIKGGRAEAFRITESIRLTENEGHSVGGFFLHRSEAEHRFVAVVFGEVVGVQGLHLLH